MTEIEIPDVNPFKSNNDHLKNNTGGRFGIPSSFQQKPQKILRGARIQVPITVNEEGT